MLKNYLITAIRNILRYKTYDFINIVGLAGEWNAASCIFLYVQDELRYDRYLPSRTYRKLTTLDTKSPE